MKSKNNFYNDFLGQSKKKKIVIAINKSISKNIKHHFLNLFHDIEKTLIVYSSSKILEATLFKTEENIIVILSDKNIELSNITNDKRLFLFHNLKMDDINILTTNDIEVVNFNNIALNEFYLSKCYITYKSLNENLYIDKSNYSGFGLFTKVQILKKHKIFSLNGQMKNQDYLNNKKFYGEWNALGNNKFLVRDERTSYGFINHSRKPNCKIDTNTMEVYSLRDIKANEEILLDYREEPLPEEYINGYGKTYL